MTRRRNAAHIDLSQYRDILQNHGELAPKNVDFFFAQAQASQFCYIFYHLTINHSLLYPHSTLPANMESAKIFSWLSPLRRHLGNIGRRWPQSNEYKDAFKRC